MSELVLFVLDLESGMPAAGLDVSVSRSNRYQRSLAISNGKTGQDGCLRLTIDPEDAKDGMVFHCEYRAGAYFGATDGSAMFQTICIDFLWGGMARLVVPLLISRNGYTAYRGS